jgi:PAS domain S-box-containing protein
MGMTPLGGSAAGHGPQPAPSVAEGSPLTVVVLTDSPVEPGRVVDCLAGAGHSVRLASAVDESVDVVVADFGAAGLDVLQALDAARSAVPAIPFIVMSGPLDADVAVDHVKRGVSDWVLKDRLERLPAAVDQAVQQRLAAGDEARASEALRESERRMARAQHVAHVGSWEWDALANTVIWSEELYDMYGRDPAGFDPSYANFLECVVDEDRPGVEESIQSAYRRQGPFQLEFRIDRPDGTVRALACRGGVEFDAGGRMVRMTGTVQDVTATRAREDALADTLRRLGEARSLARIGNWEVDLATKQVEWSDELFDLYGVRRGEFIPTFEGFCRLLNPEEADELRRHVAHAEKTGEGWENDISMTMPDGQVRIFHGRAQVDVDAAGVPVRIRGTRQDVTALRSREAQLREAEERFRLAFDEAPIGVALVALDGRWLRVNRALCQIVGYSPEEMLGLGFQDITHPDDVGADIEYIRRLLSGEIQTNEVEKRYIHSDGHVVWIQLNVSLARDDRGLPLYFITQIQDITGRKVTEEKVRSSEERFRGLMESAPDAMVIVGAQGRIVLINRQTEQMFGYDRDELLGQPVEILIPEKFRPRHAGHRSGYINDPKVRPMGAGLELFGVRRDGTEFPVEISLSPLETDEGRLVSAAIRDITERKRAESIVLGALKRERELTESLRELDRIKSDFVATVSHELRTPLTNIIGTIEMLAEGDYGELSTQQRRTVDVLDRNSHRLLDLIKDLLDLNHIESGGLGLQRTATDLGELFERVQSQVVSLAANKRIALRFEATGELGNVVIDSHQVERALLNLVTNAIKFTPAEGRVSVRASRTGDHMRFVVADNGIGIPEHEQQHLFTRFFRSSIATENAIPGTGLGLVIVKHIVEGHGGTISVDSTEGKGTTVTVSLPLAPAEDPVDHLAGAGV